jgi:hypothetical protein
MQEDEERKLERETLTATILARGLQVPGTTLEELRKAVRQDDKLIHEEELRKAEDDMRAKLLDIIERRNTPIGPSDLTTTSRPIPLGCRSWICRL